MEIADGDMTKENKIDYMLPIIADGEAGFGGPLNVFELTKKSVSYTHLTLPTSDLV